MLSPRWRKALGDLKAHRGRTALAVLAIAAGLAGAGTVLNAWALVRVATRDGFLAADAPAATLEVDSATPALLARVRTVPGVRLAESRRALGARITIEGTAHAALLFVHEDPSQARIGRLRPEGGEWPVRDGEFVIERSSLDFSGATVGGEVRLSLGDGTPLDLRLTGVARDMTLAPGWMEHLVYGYVARGTLRALGLPDALTEVRFVVDDPTLGQAAVRRLALTVRDTIRAAGQTVHRLDVPVPGEHVHAAQMDSLLYTQGAFGLLALLCSAFLVVNLITAMLAGQVREIGILKTLGGSTAQIARLYLAVALALGLVAVAVAVPLALVAGREYAALKAELLNFEVTEHALPAWVIVLQVGVGILLPMLAAAIPVRRGCGMSVAEALRDVGINDSGAAPALLHTVRGVHRPLLLSLRNAFRRRQRLALTLLALASAGAVFIGARNLRRAVIGSTDLLFAAQRYDLSLRLAAPANPDSIGALVRGIVGVRDAEVWTGGTATLEQGDGTQGDGIPVVAPPVTTRLLVPSLIEGRWLAPDAPREIVVGRAFLRVAPGVTVGALLRLELAGVTDSWTVVGIAESGPTPSLYASREAVMGLTGRGASTVVVRAELRGEASQLELIGRLRSALGEGGHAVASSARLLESRRVLEDHLLMVVEMLGAMGWVMLVVGALGLGSTMAIAVLERTREIGVLRAIGARDSTILSLVMVESLAVGLMGWALALPLSVPMSLVLGEAFGRIMVPVASRPFPDGAAVLMWLGLVLVVSVVASAWPARRALRVSAARALSYE